MLKFGSSGVLIQKTLSDNGLSIPSIRAETLKDAVNVARKMAQHGIFHYITARDSVGLLFAASIISNIRNIVILRISVFSMSNIVRVSSFLLVSFLNSSRTRVEPQSLPLICYLNYCKF